MPSRQLPSPPSPSPSSHPTALHPHHRLHRLPPTALVLAAAAGALLAVLMALALLLLWFRRRRNRRAAAKEDAKEGALERLSYRKLRRATGAFAAGGKLGQGGFGPVFRGALPPPRRGAGCGRPVAVKVMDAAGSLQGEREFHNEIAVATHLLRSSSPAAPSILLPFAYSAPRRGEGRARRMMLVYDLMPNGSLQDALLGRRCPELVAEWPRRLAVARDVAAALHYLHAVLDPPVVHGDVKPSNVLLDAGLRARLADFGLARVNSDPDPAADDKLESGAIAEATADDPTPLDDDVVSVVAESTVTTTVDAEGNVAPKSPEDDEAGGGFTLPSPTDAASTSGFDQASVDSGVNGRGSRAGRAASGSDWWWRQDNGGNSHGVKDYVVEWIRSEIKKERPKNDWIAEAAAANPGADRKKQKRRAREWWREEYTDELAKKQKRRALAKSRSEQAGLQWWERDIDDDLDGKAPSKWSMVKSWSRRSSSSAGNGNANANANGSINWWVNGARSSRDWASGDFVPKSSGAVSSTPSMRGTVCYVAPEYGGGGPLSERCDIYSYGVLLLVLISGRRPLQMSASPMSEFEKASLISWAKHLARVSRLTDLVDPALKDVNLEEALLCITVALLCIQRSPARRPSSEELVRLLSGEGEPPHLPLEFSPSPPGGFPYKSRKKVR
ncbi:receptor-like serine/threonine-protein kinase At2g45590 [Lolium rigidum]|uniref:receptor-like serine/threonine-protein kinase At2g45590 n=1 Tax=Lolium rigidum TaxID=89674 RepID=UPI001F5D392D|nr:receptor-like serine/threonine-protein kinase At2g45590 [Lolium rigidum]